MKNLRTMGCQEALEHLFSYLDDQIRVVKRRELEQHLTRCPACSARMDFERELKARLRQVGQPPVPKAFAMRIKRLLQGLKRE
jgi:mycothiol system anti-sigma-R factor